MLPPGDEKSPGPGAGRGPADALVGRRGLVVLFFILADAALQAFRHCVREIIARSVGVNVAAELVGHFGQLDIIEKVEVIHGQRGHIDIDLVLHSRLRDCSRNPG